MPDTRTLASALRRTRSSALLPALAATALLAAIPANAGAQAPSRTRRIEGELSGSLFFGNTQQTLASTRALYERSDSAFVLRVASRFLYGESTPVPGGTFVSKRSWGAESSYGLHPFDELAPYARLAFESSYENRIARRYSFGLGTLYNVVRSTATEVIFSVGAAGEHTSALPPGDSIPARTLARGITGIRMRHDLSKDLSISNETTYQPALQARSDYTITSVSALKTKLASFVSFTVTLRENYDNQAVARGARVNNDGELLIGILTTF